MSNSTRTDTLIMQAIRGVKRHRTGSAKTRHNHIKEARRFVNTIRDLGYGVQRWKNISNKHVHEAVIKWQQEKLEVATIKEYLSGVRYVCRIYGNDRIAPNNARFGVGRRVMVDNRDKSLPQEVFQRVVTDLKNSDNPDDHRIAAQLQLERHLGLRAQEAIMFNARQALLDDGRIFIQHGTKGGRERMLNDVTAQGMEAIRYARSISGRGNLIPSNFSLKTWIQKYYRVIRANGISKKISGASSHGNRHAYAQERYETITGFKAPCKFETKEAFRQNAERIAGENWRKLNRNARQIIKTELGHGPDRDDVVSQYLGSI